MLLGLFASNSPIVKAADPAPDFIQQSTQTKVTGFVTDKAGEPLIGVTVQVKGTTRAVTTDLDGQYSISVKRGETLVFTYIGSIPQEVKIDKQKGLNIIMEENSQMIDEVVVTAFGSGQKKASMVGSVQTVKPNDLKVPSANLSTSFAGRLAGVISYQRSGQPGADGASFFIRGISTIGDGTSPLIILDGVQVSSGDLNALDPEVIEAFSILKDATATALYGSRGANGVMIVTTKTGKDLAKPKINIRFEGNVSMPTKVPKFADGATYMEMYNEAETNTPSGSPLYSQEKINATRYGITTADGRTVYNKYVFPNVDWYNECFKDAAYNQKLNFNVRGGGKKLDYFMNASVNHETGMLKNRSKDFFSFNNNIELYRYAFQNNINAYLGETTKVTLRLNTQLQDLTGPTVGVGSVYGQIMNINPVDFPVMYEPDGVTESVKWGSYGGSNSTSKDNPVAAMSKGYNNSFSSTVIANLELEQKLDAITKGLRFQGLVSFKNWSSSTTTRQAPYNAYTLNDYTINPDGTIPYTTSVIGAEETVVLATTGSTTGDRSIYFQGMLDYNRSFGKHDFSGMFVYNQSEYSLNNISDDDATKRLYNSLPERKQGIAGRISYAYDNRYLIEGNFGYNGSEKFAKGHRFGFFPSIAAGYNISEESYFEPLKNVISRLKLRASWGLVGNDVTGDRFAYMSNISLSGASFTTGIDQNYERSGPTYSRYANNDLTWEVGEKINFGMDLQLFQDLNLNVDFFRENRRDIFQKRGTIANYLGTASTVVYGNLAEMRNQGLDMSIDYGKKIGKDWTITAKGTFTYAHNKITKFDEPSVQQYRNLMNVGQSANSIRGFIAQGLFIDANDVKYSPAQKISGSVAAGDIKYVDIANVNGVKDGAIDDNDKVVMGHPTVPEIIYGFGPSISYKKIDLGFFVQGAANVSLMMSGFHPFGTQARRNVLDFIAEDHWSPSNQNVNAAYPRLTKVDHANNTTASTFWLRDASFLKLKNFEIGYSFKNMRVYLSGTNLLTLSSFKLWDPEQGGGSGLSYPTQRVFNIGFQMNIN